MGWNHDFDLSFPPSPPRASRRLAAVALGLVSAGAAWALALLTSPAGNR